MNHQERKLAKRAAKPAPTYTLTADQIQAMKQEAYDKAWIEYNSRIEEVKKEATDAACRAAIAVPMVVVHDKLGFGSARANRFLDWMMTWLRAINDDPGTLVELQELVYEFYGIKLMEDK